MQTFTSSDNVNCLLNVTFPDVPSDDKIIRKSYHHLKSLIIIVLSATIKGIKLCGRNPEEQKLKT